VAKAAEEPRDPSVADLEAAAKHLMDDVALAARCSERLKSERSGEATSEARTGACEEILQQARDEALSIRSSRLAGLASFGLKQVLVEQRRRFRLLKKWVSRRAPGDDREDLDSVVNVVKLALQRVLEAEGLRESFTAEVVQGVMVQSSGDAVDDKATSTQPTYLRWRSRRFWFESRDQDRGVELMLSGRLGWQPALALVAAPASSSTAKQAGRAAKEGEVATTHERAFAWDAKVEALWAFGDALEAVAEASVGQIWLDSKPLVRSAAGQPALVDLLPGPGGRANGIAEAGLRLRYHETIREIRAEQPSVEPLVEVSLAYRRDARFKLESATSSKVLFHAPADRLVARFQLAGIPIVNKKDPEARPLHFGFGVEHEWGLRKGGVPSATRIFLTADLSVLEALTK
jgi:hypothetical protein